MFVEVRGRLTGRKVAASCYDSQASDSESRRNRCHSSLCLTIWFRV